MLRAVVIEEFIDSRYRRCRCGHYRALHASGRVSKMFSNATKRVLYTHCTLISCDCARYRWRWVSWLLH